MLKSNFGFLLLFILVAILVFTLWFINQTEDSDITTSVIQVKPTIKQKTILYEEVSPSISFEDADKELLPAPNFILQATTGTKALITINTEPCQWFHTGETLIGHYTLHSIDRTLVIIFDGKGAYYEITLNDAPMEEEVFEDDENTVDQDTPNTKEMIDIGDGQYISYGNKDVSSNRGEETFDQDSQAVDTSDQTIIYGDEDVSQQTDIYPNVEDEEMAKDR